MKTKRQHFGPIGLRAAAGALFAVMFAAAPDAFAQGWYLELGAGQSKVKDFGCGLPTFPTCSADDTDTGFSVHGGYWFRPNAAVEFGYTYLGFAKAEGTVNLPPVVPFDADFESWGYDLAAVGRWPIGERVALYGRIGFFAWKHEAEVFVGGGGGFTSETESGTDPLFGFGAEFAIGKRSALRLQWQRFLDVGGDDTGESDIDLVSVNLVFGLGQTQR